MNKFLTIFLLFLILLAPAVLSQPLPFQQGEFLSGLTINYPPINYVEQNQDYYFHFHVFNTSNGVPVLNRSVQCYFHLYNSSGQHIFKLNNIKKITDDLDFAVNVKGTNFTKLGNYDFLFQCNNSIRGGFLDESFKVTTDGDNDVSKDKTTGIAIVIFILFCTAVLFFVPFFKDFSSYEITNLVIKRSMWSVSLYLMVLNSAIMASLVEASNLSLSSEFFRYMWLFGIGGYIMLVFMVLSTILDVIKIIKSRKNNERMGA